MLISLSEMSAEWLIGKLVIIEHDPFEIWRALKECYGMTYFNQVIEKEMGVTQDFKEKLFKEMREKLHESANDSLVQVTFLERNTKNEVKRLKQYGLEQQNRSMTLSNEFNDLL